MHLENSNCRYFKNNIFRVAFIIVQTDLLAAVARAKVNAAEAIQSNSFSDARSFLLLILVADQVRAMIHDKKAVSADIIAAAASKGTRGS